MHFSNTSHSGLQLKFVFDMWVLCGHLRAQQPLRTALRWQEPFYPTVWVSVLVDYHLKITGRDVCFDIRKEQSFVCSLSSKFAMSLFFVHTVSGREMSRCQQQHGLAQRHKCSHLNIEALRRADVRHGSKHGIELWLQLSFSSEALVLIIYTVI